jgi:plastocyanin
MRKSPGPIALLVALLMPAAAWLHIATVPASARAAAAGTIRGQVDIKRTPTVVEPRPDVSSLGGAMRAAAPEVRPAVVYLETAPVAAVERDDSHATMVQRNETFVPHVLAVTVGTTVDFPNVDRVYHNVFSLSRARPFDLGRYAAGSSKSIRFDRPGVVQVFCDIHSHMSAYILVFAHRFYAVTDDEGRYRLDGVPPGVHSVAMWYEGVVRDSRSVTVPDNGGTADLDFSLRRADRARRP